MSLIVLSNYKTMVKQSPELYSTIRGRIKDEFYLNKDKDMHATYICFNLLYSLIKKEDNKDDFF